MGDEEGAKGRMHFLNRIERERERERERGGGGKAWSGVQIQFSSKLSNLVLVLKNYLEHIGK